MNLHYSCTPHSAHADIEQNAHEYGGTKHREIYSPKIIPRIAHDRPTISPYFRSGPRLSYQNGSMQKRNRCQARTHQNSGADPDY